MREINGRHKPFFPSSSDRQLDIHKQTKRQQLLLPPLIPCSVFLTLLPLPFAARTRSLHFSLKGIKDLSICNHEESNREAEVFVFCFKAETGASVARRKRQRHYFDSQDIKCILTHTPNHLLLLLPLLLLSTLFRY